MHQLKNWPCCSSSRSSTSSGVGATVAAELAERAILSLEAPIARVAADTVYPFTQAENVWLPNKNDIIEKAKATLEF